MFLKTKQNPNLFSFFFFFFEGTVLLSSLQSHPPTRPLPQPVQISIGPSGPPSTGWARPTLARDARSRSLGSLLSLLPTSSRQAPPHGGAHAHRRTRGCRGARAAMAAGGGGVADPLSPAGVPCAFSPLNQAYFALASADGQLRVWETANNRLHQEYVPSAHLSGTCTCLAWAPARLQAKVKQAGRRGAGVRRGSASAHPRSDGAWPGISRGRPRPGARRHGVRRRGLGPLRQSRVRPAGRVAKEGAARFDGW